jgi:hypothetical protein
MIEIRKRPKEMTLEELIIRETEMLEKNKQTTNSHIEKLTVRHTYAVGDEKIRLQSLIELHQNHLSNLESTDPVVIATEKFQKLNSGN